MRVMHADVSVYVLPEASVEDMNDNEQYAWAVASRVWGEDHFILLFFYFIY